MARTLKDAGQGCWAVFEGDDLLARIVPHDSGTGWKVVGLDGHALSTRSFETPEIALRVVPTPPQG